MDIGDLIKTQDRLTQTQIEITNLIEKEKRKNLELEDVNSEAKHEMIGDILKLTIPEYPPKINVFHRIEVVDGSIVGNAYQSARNRWYSLVRKALKGYEGGRIDPAIVYLVYYVPWMCDVSNFVGKIIIDGLMYFGAIAADDNLEHVPVEVQEARLDKENPRTEVYVIKHTNQVEKILTPYKEEKRINKEIEEYKKRIERLEKEIDTLRAVKEDVNEEEGMSIISKKEDERDFEFLP